MVTLSQLGHVHPSCPSVRVRPGANVRPHVHNQASTGSWRGQLNNGWLPARISEYLGAQSRYFVAVCRKNWYLCHDSSRPLRRQPRHPRLEALRVGLAGQEAVAVEEEMQDRGHCEEGARRERARRVVSDGGGGCGDRHVAAAEVRRAQPAACGPSCATSRVCEWIRCSARCAFFSGRMSPSSGSPCMPGGKALPVGYGAKKKLCGRDQRTSRAAHAREDTAMAIAHDDWENTEW